MEPWRNVAVRELQTEILTQIFGFAWLCAERLQNDLAFQDSRSSIR